MGTRTAIPPALLIGNPSPEHTFQVLEQRLNSAEVDTQALVEQLASLGFTAENSHAPLTPSIGDGANHEPISPYKPRIADTEILQRNYEALVSRVCKAESAIQTMKLNILRYQTDRDLNKNEKANMSEKLAVATEAFEMELAKLSKELVQTRQELKDALSSRIKMEEDVRRLQEALQGATTEKANALADAGELKSSKQKLNKRVADMREELTNERNLRASLEDSHKTLLTRIKDLETIVDSESSQVKSMSSNYGAMKAELLTAKENCVREHGLRSQMEKTIKGLAHQRDKIQHKLKAVESDKELLLNEITKLKNQYSELNKQLDSMGTVVTEKKDLHNKLEEENKQLHEAIKAKSAENAEIMKSYEARLQHERTDADDKIQNSPQMIQMSEKLSQETKNCEHLRQKVSYLEGQLTEVTEKNRTKETELTKVQADLLRFKKMADAEKVDKEKALKDKENLLDEVNQAVDSMSDERARLQTELDKQNLEVTSLEQAKKQLHDENARLLERVSCLELQQVSQKKVDNTIQEMQDQKNKLAYENGKIQSKLEQLQSELEGLSTSKVELNQLKSVHAALESKFTKTSSDLNTAQIHIQRLENQVKQVQTASDRKEKDFELAIKSRDDALREKETMTNKLKHAEDGQDAKVVGLQKSLDEVRSDNKRMASRLENVMSAHRQSQASVENLQVELGKKDSQLAQMHMEKAKTHENLRELQRKIDVLQDKVSHAENLEESEMEPLRNQLSNVRDDNMKMAATLEELMHTNAKLQTAVQNAENKVEKKQRHIQDLERTSDAVKAESQREVKALQERLANVQDQCQREKEKTVKKTNRDLTDVRKQLDELYGKNGELSRANGELRGRVAELEGQLKESKVRISSQRSQLDHMQKARKQQEETLNNMQVIQKQINELEKSRDHYAKKNKDQGETIKQFVSQVSELQEELRNLTKTYSEKANLLKKHEAALEKEKQHNAHVKRKYKEAKQREQDLLEIHRKTEEKLIQANSESLQIASNLQDAHNWFKSKFDGLQNELKGSRASASNLEQVTYQQKVLLEEERRKADEMATKAKELIRASRKQISRLADFAEKSQNETSQQLRVMHTQLQSERDYAKLAEQKYNQLMETSLKHTEDLTKDYMYTPQSLQSISSISYD